MHMHIHMQTGRSEGVGKHWRLARLWGMHVRAVVCGVLGQTTVSCPYLIDTIFFSSSGH